MQLLLPLFLSAVGLGVLTITIAENYPSLLMEVSQWRDPIEYKIPTANFTFNDNIFIDDLSLFTFYNSKGFKDEVAGSMLFYDMPYDKDHPLLEDVLDDENATLNEQLEYMDSMKTRVEDFQSILLKHSSDTKKIPYNAWYFTPEVPRSILLGVNASAHHSLPVSFNVLNRWLLKNKIDENSDIFTSSHPLPVSVRQDLVGDQISGFFGAL
ncbi:MAG: hypothetical protein GY950_33945, partial [bacterium]|nr:hypothetical protein [bacterium]